MHFWDVGVLHANRIFKMTAEQRLTTPVILMEVRPLFQMPHLSLKRRLSFVSRCNVHRDRGAVRNRNLAYPGRWSLHSALIPLDRIVDQGVVRSQTAASLNVQVRESGVDVPVQILRLRVGSYDPAVGWKFPSDALPSVGKTYDVSVGPLQNGSTISYSVKVVSCL